MPASWRFKNYQEDIRLYYQQNRLINYQFARRPDPYFLWSLNNFMSTIYMCIPGIV